MIDLHIHSTFSDGELIPSEISRRLSAMNYEAFAITDHVDFSNMDHVLSSLLKLRDFMEDYEITMIPGVELTHIPPRLIGRAARMARKLGAEIVIVHGETIAEPVKEGTNLSAVNEEIDILAHPGLVDERTCEIASDNGIYFEITSRRGHSLTNGHVAKMAQMYGVKLVLNTDSHSPFDFITGEQAVKILRGAGIEDAEGVFRNSSDIVRLKK
ncbi:histidinol phosphate phosphatase domain-containing protein [Geoglobus acetivorans]|uniref:Polymerase/histidinol phosphatase N-terminal domain-containing protein n=1 Tax=Geoglobus acetivorans TaxID=565033 RepID=A0A0A7GCI1_GEOAI|nr:hypothetical protein GACE_0689 [Geoglobus acetivorans]